MVKKNIISKFESGYYLAIPPSPPLLNVLCLFPTDSYGDVKIDLKQPIAPSKVKIDPVIEYKDYGLVEWLFTPDNIPEDKKGLVEKFYSETTDKFSNLQSWETSILSPLSHLDWKHWHEVVSYEEGSIGFV